MRIWRGVPWASIFFSRTRAKARASYLVRKLLGRNCTRISSRYPATVGGRVFFVHAGGNAKWLGARMALFSFCSHIKLHVARYYLVRKIGHFCHAVAVLYFLRLFPRHANLKKGYGHVIFSFRFFGTATPALELLPVLVDFRVAQPQPGQILEQYPQKFE